MKTSHGMPVWLRNILAVLIVGCFSVAFYYFFIRPYAYRWKPCHGLKEYGVCIPEVNKIVDQINETVANLKTGKYHAVALTSQLFDVVSLVENLLAFNDLKLNTFQSKVWNKLRNATYQRYTKDGNLLNFIPFP